MNPKTKQTFDKAQKQCDRHINHEDFELEDRKIEMLMDEADRLRDLDVPERWNQ
jgi:hypothetical protein